MVPGSGSSTEVVAPLTILPLLLLLQQLLLLLLLLQLLLLLLLLLLRLLLLRRLLLQLLQLLLLLVILLVAFCDFKFMSQPVVYACQCSVSPTLSCGRFQSKTACSVCALTDTK